MATHMENAAGHLAEAMLSEPGSDEAVFHACATAMFEHTATTSRSSEEIHTADEKFQALRASGFTGPIDQDGNRVTDSHPLKALLDAIRSGDA